MQKSCTCKRYGLLSPELQIIPNACVLHTVYLHQKAVNVMRSDVHLSGMFEGNAIQTTQSAEIGNLERKTDMINTILLHIKSHRTFSHLWEVL